MLQEFYCGEIYIRHAIEELPDKKSFQMHIHDECEIYFFVSGRVNYLVESTTYPLEKNSVAIMRPAEAHMPQIIGDAQYERYAINFPSSYVLKFDPEGLLLKPFIDRDLGKYNYYDPEELDMKLVGRMFAEMIQAKGDYERELTLTTHLLFLLSELNRAFLRKNKTDEFPKSPEGKMISYVNQHLFEPISVPILAEHFYLSSSQFSRIFKMATGAPPWEYILKKRLTAARQEIRNGVTAQKAAEKCGFGNYSAFYRAFVGHYGYAPTDSETVVGEIVSENVQQSLQK